MDQVSLIFHVSSFSAARPCFARLGALQGYDPGSVFWLAIQTLGLNSSLPAVLASNGSGSPWKPW
jgi:hypothetical protein